MKEVHNEEQIKNVFNEYTTKAQKTLNDMDKLGNLIKQVENQLSTIPQVGDAFSYIPLFISLLRSYMKREYTDIPIGSLLAIIGALLYFVNPFDIIPDFLPVIGKIDDLAIIALAIKQVKTDLDAYKKWLDEKQAVSN